MRIRACCRSALIASPSAAAADDASSSFLCHRRRFDAAKPGQETGARASTAARTR